MAATFEIDKRDAVSRLRLAMFDHVALTAPPTVDDPTYQDEEYRAFLDATAAREAIVIYLPVDGAGLGPDGETAATVEVAIGATAVEMTLVRTGGASPGTDGPFDLSVGLATDTLEELFDAIEALDKGWTVGLEVGSVANWWERGDWRDVSSWAQRLARANFAGDIGLTGSALPCLGFDAAQKLSLYNLDAAELRTLHSLSNDPTRYHSRKEGNASWTRQAVMDAIASKEREIGPRFAGIWRRT